MGGATLSDMVHGCPAPHVDSQRRGSCGAGGMVCEGLSRRHLSAAGPSVTWYSGGSLGGLATSARKAPPIRRRGAVEELPWAECHA